MKDIAGAHESVTFLRCTNEAKGTTGSIQRAPRGGSQGLLSTKHYSSILGSGYFGFRLNSSIWGSSVSREGAPKGVPKGHLRAPEELVHTEKYRFAIGKR